MVRRATVLPNAVPCRYVYILLCVDGHHRYKCRSPTPQQTDSHEERVTLPVETATSEYELGQLTVVFEFILAMRLAIRRVFRGWAGF